MMEIQEFSLSLKTTKFHKFHQGVNVHNNFMIVISHAKEVLIQLISRMILL